MNRTMKMVNITRIENADKIWITTSNEVYGITKDDIIGINDEVIGFTRIMKNIQRDTYIRIKDILTISYDYKLKGD